MIADPLRALTLTAVDGDGAGDLRVSARGLRVRFDLAAIPSDAVITRAVLSLHLDATGLDEGSVTLRARALLAPWRPGSRDDTPRSEGSAEVSLPAGRRGPVRVDVTAILLEAARWGRRDGDLALSCERGELRVADAWAAVGAPRLEVTAR